MLARRCSILCCAYFVDLRLVRAVFELTLLTRSEEDIYIYFLLSESFHFIWFLKPKVSPLERLIWSPMKPFYIPQSTTQTEDQRMVSLWCSSLRSPEKGRKKIKPGVHSTDYPSEDVCVRDTGLQFFFLLVAGTKTQKARQVVINW